LGILGSISAQNIESGKASYYSDVFQGRKTASGELYNKEFLTAAHRSFPFGTWVKVTNVKNKKSVIVKINDRGPHFKGRIIDLSRKAMESLEGIDAGIIEVTLEIVERNTDG
jgi:rare lipoprotein A